MPLVGVTLGEERSAEQIRALIHELTGAVDGLLPPRPPISGW